MLDVAPLQRWTCGGKFGVVQRRTLPCFGVTHTQKTQRTPCGRPRTGVRTELDEKGPLLENRESLFHILSCFLYLTSRSVFHFRIGKTKNDLFLMRVRFRLFRFFGFFGFVFSVSVLPVFWLRFFGHLDFGFFGFFASRRCSRLFWFFRSSWFFGKTSFYCFFIFFSFYCCFIFLDLVFPFFRFRFFRFCGVCFIGFPTAGSL